MLTSFHCCHDNYIIKHLEFQVISHYDAYVLLSIKINLKSYDKRAGLGLKFAASTSVDIKCGKSKESTVINGAFFSR